MDDQFEPFQPFNECLSIGYFEETHIGVSIAGFIILCSSAKIMQYHDDGEKELGPTVATISLGAMAEMTFKPKSKNSIGLLNGTDGPQTFKSKKHPQKEKPVCLRLNLEHGDIMVMHGRKIQQFYDVSDLFSFLLVVLCVDLNQHAVVPKGLRFALTCRYIRPDMMANDHEAQDAIFKGTLPPGSEKYNYDGDINAAPVVQSVSEVDKFVNNITAKLKSGNLTVDQVRKINKRLTSLFPSANAEHETVVESLEHEQEIKATEHAKVTEGQQDVAISDGD